MGLSKAYDPLPHDLMVTKLGAYDLPKESLQLISDYLSYSKQSMKTGSKLNDCANIIQGIPRNSILGPLLFNIFIIDVALAVEKSDIYHFPDNFEQDMRNVLYRIKINSLSEIQFMILGK